MKYLLSLTFLLFVLQSAAQQRVFKGRVVDDKKQGIPYAIIEAKEQHQGVYTDENGYFAFTADAAMVRTLAVFCMGYEEQELLTANLPQDSLLIQLKQRATTLKTVQIKSHKGKRRTTVLGKGRRALKYDGDMYRMYGAETAIKLKADTGQYEATLKEVYVYVADEGEPTTRFRVKVYEWGELPEREITDSNVIVHATKGGKWVKVDLSNKYIPVGDGLFVGVEWIAGFGNKEVGLQSEKGDVQGFNGQVIGITDGYGQPSITYSRKPFSKEWEYYDPADARRKGGYFLNPMIYCTYTYIK